ncbi:MAG: nitrate reductase [Sulfurospirillum sp.]|nr:MAG: nitrate reductase [Sulfurospirillum sp.]
MNISSIVIQCTKEHFDEVKEWCEKSDLCDYHFGDPSIGKIIVTIEGEGVSEEIAKLTKIQQNPHIIAADMMMSYQEELDEEIKKLNAADPVPAMLNDEDIDVTEIVYNGDLKHKF